MHKATVASAALHTFLLVGWLIAIPFMFALLYSVIEMQSSARVAVGANTKLASYTVSRIADRIIFLEQSLATQKPQYAKAIEDSQKSDAILVEATRNSNAMIGSAAKLLWGNNTAAHPCDEGLRCLEEVLIESAQHTWGGDAAIAKQVEAARTASNRLQDLIFEHASRKIPIEQLGESIRQEEAELAATVGTGVKPADARSADDPEDAHSVALSYNKQRQIPFFEALFFLPAGVVIALFTGLMGAIGAAIFSMFSQLNPVVDDSGSTTRTLLEAYGIRPLLGALAGFTVFFVVSAGASFLIQPGGASATQAVNQLSPPALASLGIFSGLASDRALGWLIEKAHSFFQVGAANSGDDVHGPK